MGKYLANRLLQTIPTVFLITIVVFMMLHLTPGDPVLVFIGDKRSTPEQREKIREDMGLNRPIAYSVPDLHGATPCAGTWDVPCRPMCR